LFTGIVTDIGRVAAVERGRAAKRFTIDSRYDAATIDLGASISHAGCCLTVVEREARPGGSRHVVEVSEETLARTTLGRWEAGTPVNLERSLKAGDELGGHFVSGHVDGVGTVRLREPVGGSVRFVIEAPAALDRFIAEKGSIAVDGVSLTVNGVQGARFGLTIIPHTLEATTLGNLQPGSPVNLEIDLLARYLGRLLDARGGHVG
jgi:riboflavin synthase